MADNNFDLNEDFDIDALIKETKYLVEKEKAEENARMLKQNEVVTTKKSHFKEEPERIGIFKISLKGKEKDKEKIDGESDEETDEKSTVTYTQYAPSVNEKSNNDVDEKIYKGTGLPIDYVPPIDLLGETHTPPSEPDPVEYINYTQGMLMEQKKRYKKKSKKESSVFNSFKKVIGINSSENDDKLNEERPTLFSFLRSLTEDNESRLEDDDNEDEVDISVEDNMEDIYSTSEHTVKVKKTNPLEISDSETENKIPLSSDTRSYKRLNLEVKVSDESERTKNISLENEFDEEDELTLKLLFGNNNTSDKIEKFDENNDKFNEKQIRKSETVFESSTKVGKPESVSENSIEPKTNNIILIKDINSQDDKDLEHTKPIKVKVAPVNGTKSKISNIAIKPKQIKVISKNVETQDKSKPQIKVTLVSDNKKAEVKSEALKNDILQQDKAINTADLDLAENSEIVKDNSENQVKTISAENIKTDEKIDTQNQTVKNVDTVESNTSNIKEESEEAFISKEKLDKIADTAVKIIKEKEKETVGTNGEYPVMENNIDDIDNMFVEDLTAPKYYRNKTTSQTSTQTQEIKSSVPQKSQKPSQDIKKEIPHSKVDKPMKSKQAIPRYTMPSDEDTIIANVGSFTKTVAFEYDNYPKIPQPKKENEPFEGNGKIINMPQTIPFDREESTQYDEEKDIKSDGANKKTKESIWKKLKKNNEVFSEEEIIDYDPVEKEFEEDIYLEVEDYIAKEDRGTIQKQLISDRHSLIFRCVGITLIALFSVIYFIMNLCKGNFLQSMNLPYYEYYSISIDLILVILACLVCRVTISNGFNKLFSLKGNADTAVTFAIIMAGLQDIVMLLMPEGYRNGTIELYSVIAIIALAVNTYGKFLIAKRIHENFKFVASDKPKYAAKIYKNENTASKMVSGTTVHKPFIVYQRETAFLKNFMKLSYVPDSLEKLSGKIAPIGTALSIVMGIIYITVFWDFAGAVSAAALCACIVTPVCNILGLNMPLNKICKESLNDGAMLIGSEGIKQFCDSNAIMLDIEDLYNGKDVKLQGFHPVNNSKQEDCIKYAATLAFASKSILSDMFMKMVQNSNIILPSFENVEYEDDRGVVGWVDGKRAFLGNKKLMIQYDIPLPEYDYDEKYSKEGKYIVYIAVSSKLIGMFVVTYKANSEMIYELQRMEDHGICFLIRTTNFNIKAEKIARDFGVYLRSVKILPIGMGNICKNERDTKDKATRAYMVTRGKMSSFCRVLTACIYLSSKATLVTVLQLVAVILGVVLFIALSMIAGISSLGVIKPLVYMIAWIAVICLVPKFTKL